MRPIASILAIWGVFVFAGIGWMWHYSLSAGSEDTSLNVGWPESSTLARESGKPTLVVFFHPYCPCSRASLNELSILAAKCRDPFGLRVVFTQPEGVEFIAAENDLISLARAIPGAVITLEKHEREKELFGVKTSGIALLFSADGRLKFKGGITHSRGHEGESVGRVSLTALIRGEDVDIRQTPVFGCPL